MGKTIAGLFVVVALGMAWAIVSAQYGIQNSAVSALVTGAMAIVIFLSIYFCLLYTSPSPRD